MDVKSTLGHPGDAELPVPMTEAFTYWDDLRGDRVAPMWPEFHLDEVSPRAVP